MHEQQQNVPIPSSLSIDFWGKNQCAALKVIV